MKKLFSTILVLGLLLSGNAYAKKGDRIIVYSSPDAIRIQIITGKLFSISDKKFEDSATQMFLTAQEHCNKYNKKMFYLMSQKNGKRVHNTETLFGKVVYNFYCAKNLKQTIYLYKSRNFPSNEYWSGPVYFYAGPKFEMKSVQDVLNKQKQIELAKKREAEKRLAKQRKREAEKRLAEQKKLAEANKKNSPSKSNSSGKERAKQAMSYKGGVAMKGFLGGLIGMALGFGLYSIMDRKIKKKINDKYFLGGAFFIGWIISKFL